MTEPTPVSPERGVQPPSETPAQRATRDLELQRGDWQRNPANDNLAYVPRNTVGSRYDRTYEHRKGDVYYTYDEDNKPVRTVAEDGRNERIYVDYETGVSAVAGTAHPRYAQFRDSVRSTENDAPAEAPAV